VFRLYACRNGAVFRVARLAGISRIRNLLRRTDRRRDADRWLLHAHRDFRAVAGADRRNVGTRGQRLALYVAQRRLGVSCVPDAGRDRRGPSGQRTPDRAFHERDTAQRFVAATCRGVIFTEMATRTRAVEWIARVFLSTERS